MKKFKRHLITSALPYANGPIHIGHLAGVYVPSDIYTRYLRMRGEDVISICGSDEHGVPITLKARKEGITPQEVVDRYHELNKKAFADFGIAFDIYSRTSNKIHYETASEFFRKLYDQGEFIEKTSSQYYDEEAGCFLADRYITGTCPHCGNADEANRIIDGNLHSGWSTVFKPNQPNAFVIDLGSDYTLKAFTYMPVQGHSPEGIISHYEFAVSSDNRTWRTVSKGEFGNIKNNSIEQVVNIDPVKCRYIKLMAKGVVDDSGKVSAAEIGVITQ